MTINFLGSRGRQEKTKVCASELGRFTKKTSAGVLYTILYFSSAQASAPAPTGRAGGKPRSRAAWILQPPPASLAGRPLASVHAERPVHAHSKLCPRKRGTLMPTSGWDALCLCSLSVLSVSVHVTLCLSRSATSLRGWRTERPWRPPHPSRPPPERLGAWQTWRRLRRSRPRRWRAARRGRRG